MLEFIHPIPCGITLYHEGRSTEMNFIGQAIVTPARQSFSASQQAFRVGQQGCSQSGSLLGSAPPYDEPAGGSDLKILVCSPAEFLPLFQLSENLGRDRPPR